MRQSLYLSLFLMFSQLACVSITAQTWYQLGSDIYLGKTSPYERINDFALSDDGQTVVIAGSTKDTSISWSSVGFARVYDWNGSSWIQRNVKVFPDSISYQFTGQVALSGNGNIVALSRYTDTAMVSIYEWDGLQWTQKGSNLLEPSDSSAFGYVIDMNIDGSTLAIAAPSHINYDTSWGYVALYEWNGSDWQLKGSPIVSDNWNAHGFSTSVDLSSDGNHLAVGAHLYSDYFQLEYFKGALYSYAWNGSEWIQIGATKIGEKPDKQLGRHVAIDETGQTISTTTFLDDWEIHTYSLDSNSNWQPKGNAIIHSGLDHHYITELSDDGQTVIICGQDNGPAGSTGGFVQAYQWFNGQWAPIGNRIKEKDSLILYANKLDVNGAANAIAVSGYKKIAHNTVHPFVRVYGWQCTPMGPFAMAVEACDRYWLPSGHQKVEKSGVYLDTITSSTGCDSILSISVTIDTLLPIIEQKESGELYTPTPSLSYQWINCDKENQVIEGATTPSFAPDSSGRYAVIVENRSCIDTSNCRWVTIEQPMPEKAEPLPNPTSGPLTMPFPEGYDKVEIRVANLTGQVQWKGLYFAGKPIQLSIDGATGMYVVSIWAKNQMLSTHKVLKQE